MLFSDGGNTAKCCFSHVVYLRLFPYSEDVSRTKDQIFFLLCYEIRKNVHFVVCVRQIMQQDDDSS